MQELLVVLLVRRSLYRIEEDIVEQMIELLLHLVVTHDLLGVPIVHAENMIYNLD